MREKRAFLEFCSIDGAHHQVLRLLFIERMFLF